MSTRSEIIIRSPAGIDENCSKFMIDEVTIPFVLHTISKIGQLYTLSFFILSEAEGSISLNHREIQTSTDWTKYELTFTATSEDIPIYFNVAGTYYIYQAKLEIGNKATDWTPAPEDVDSKIEEAQTTANNAQLNIESANARIDTLVTRTDSLGQSLTSVTQTADKINWLVKSGTSSSNFTLTDRTATLITNSLVIKDSTGASTIISGGKMDINQIFAQDIKANGTITGAKLSGATGSFTGNITATSGKIGSFNINNSLYTNSNTLIYRGSDSNVYLGSDGIGFGNSCLSSGGGMSLRSYDGTTAQLEGGSLYLFTNDGTDIPYLEAVAANTKANSGLHLYCPADFDSTLSISGAVTCKSNLTVNKSATFNSTIDCDSSITAYKHVYVGALGRKVGLAAQDGDKVGLYDYTNSKWLIYSESDGGIPIKIPNLSIGTYINSSVALSCSSFEVDGWVNNTGEYGWRNTKHGGGWYMSDDTWIRSYGSKSIYHNSGILRTDGTLQVGTNGAYFNSNSTDTRIKNLLFDDYSGHMRRAASSVETDGARVSYIASKLRTSDTKYYVTIQGQYGTTGSTYNAYNYLSTSSDVRLKENIADSNISALDTINEIKIRQFDYRQTGNHQKIGVVADELELIDTAFTFGGGYTEDGSMNIKSVDTFYMMGYVVKGIQEICSADNERDEKIQSNEARVNSLQTQLNEAMNQIAELKKLVELLTA